MLSKLLLLVLMAAVIAAKDPVSVFTLENSGSNVAGLFSSAAGGETGLGVDAAELEERMLDAGADRAMTVAFGNETF